MDKKINLNTIDTEKLSPRILCKFYLATFYQCTNVHNTIYYLIQSEKVNTCKKREHRMVHNKPSQN